MTTEVPPESAADAGVDTTPLAVNDERRNSLEKHLQLRPEEADLKNRHILLDTTAAPALQARAAELERQRITDNLKKVCPYVRHPTKGGGVVSERMRILASSWYNSLCIVAQP